MTSRDSRTGAVVAGAGLALVLLVIVGVLFEWSVRTTFSYVITVAVLGGVCGFYVDKRHKARRGAPRRGH